MSFKYVFQLVLREFFVMQRWGRLTSTVKVILVFLTLESRASKPGSTHTSTHTSMQG